MPSQRLTPVERELIEAGRALARALADNTVPTGRLKDRLIRASAAYGREETQA